MNEWKTYLSDQYLHEEFKTDKDLNERGKKFNEEIAKLREFTERLEKREHFGEALAIAKEVWRTGGRSTKLSENTPPRLHLEYEETKHPVKLDKGEVGENYGDLEDSGAIEQDIAEERARGNEEEPLKQSLADKIDNLSKRPEQFKRTEISPVITEDEETTRNEFNEEEKKWVKRMPGDESGMSKRYYEFLDKKMPKKGEDKDMKAHEYITEEMVKTGNFPEEWTDQNYIDAINDLNEDFELANKKDGDSQDTLEIQKKVNALRNALNRKREPVQLKLEEVTEEKEEPKKPGLFARMGAGIRSLWALGEAPEHPKEDVSPVVLEERVETKNDYDETEVDWIKRKPGGKADIDIFQPLPKKGDGHLIEEASYLENSMIRNGDYPEDWTLADFEMAKESLEKRAESLKAEVNSFGWDRNNIKEIRGRGQVSKSVLRDEMKETLEDAKKLGAEIEKRQKEAGLDKNLETKEGLAKELEKYFKTKKEKVEIALSDFRMDGEEKNSHMIATEKTNIDIFKKCLELVKKGDLFGTIQSAHDPEHPITTSPYDEVKLNIPKTSTGTTIEDKLLTAMEKFR